MKNVISQSLGLVFVNINVYAKVYQNFPLSSRGLFSLFQNLNLGNASANWHLTISWATSCQYHCVCKILSKYSKRFKSYRHFSQIGRRQNLHKLSGDKIKLAKPRPMINVILQFLGLDLFNIKLSAKFSQNIPNGLIVNFHFFQNLNLGKTSTNPKCYLTISWATSCQYTNVYAKLYHNIPLSSSDRAIFTFLEFGARQNLDRRKMTFLNLLG